jgi:hypothetical protein
MKKTLFAMLLIGAATHAHSQVSIDAGFNSRFQGTAKIAIEAQTSWINTELGVRASMDNWHPIVSLQTGYGTDNGFQQDNIRFMIGYFIHTGILPVGKETRQVQAKIGGSIRYELNHGLVNFEYNGETFNLTFGFIFKSKYK